MPFSADAATTPRRLRLERAQHAGEGLDHHQVRDRPLRRIGRGDIVEEGGADDAARPPDLCDRAERQVPVPGLRGLGHHVEALRIGGDLAGEQRLLEDAERLLLVAEGALQRLVRRAEQRLAGDPLGLPCRRGSAPRRPPRSPSPARRGPAPPSPTSGRCPSVRRCRGCRRPAACR